MKMMINSNRNGDCVVFMVVGLWLVVIGDLSLTIDSEERKRKVRGNIKLRCMYVQGRWVG